MMRKPDFRAGCALVALSRYTSMGLAVAAVVCILVANSATGENRTFLLSLSYFLLGGAFVAIIVMLVMNWLGWTDEEVEQGHQDRKR